MASVGDGTLNRPFVWCFRTPNRHYVYDVNTNGFFRVPPVFQDVLTASAYPGAIGFSELVARHGASAVEDARRELLAQQERGVFLSTRPTALHFKPNRQELEAKLSKSQRMMTLCLTEFCNLRCEYCVYGGGFTEFRGHSTVRMEWETARRAIDLFFASAEESPEIALTFYGGEPLTNLPLLDAAASYARMQRSSGLSFTLTTNGTLLNDRAVDILVKHSIDIMVSLDGPAEVHDSVRRDSQARGSFDRIMINLGLLRSRHPDYYRERVSFNVTYRNVLDLPRIRDFFASRSDLFDGAPIRVSSVSRPGDEPSPSESETKQIEATWKGLATDYLRSMVDGVSPDPILMGLYYADLMRIHRRRQTPMPPTLHPNGICDPGGRRLFCTVDGELQVCERVGEGFTLGDVERGVDAGAALRLAESYAASSTRSGCCDCPAVRLCTTCFTTAVVQRGEAHAQHKHCKAIRANLEHMMSVYCAIGEARPEALGAFENAGVRELSDLV